jgi:hypothetical protein
MSKRTLLLLVVAIAASLSITPAGHAQRSAVNPADLTGVVGSVGGVSGTSADLGFASTGAWTLHYTFDLERCTPGGPGTEFAVTITALSESAASIIITPTDPASGTYHHDSAGSFRVSLESRCGSHLDVSIP